MTRTVKYVGYVPSNLKKELEFMNVMERSGLITQLQHNNMIKKLVDNGHMDTDHETYSTGNDFFFSIRGDERINTFRDNMRKYMPNEEYSLNDDPASKVK